MRTIKILMLAVLLGAGLVSCDKEDDDFTPAAGRSEPVQSKPLEVEQEEQESGQPASELEDPLDDEPS